DDFSLCFPQHGIRKICVYRITENGENRRSISMNHAVRAQFVPPALRGMSHVLSPLRVVVRAGVFICEFVESHFFLFFLLRECCSTVEHVSPCSFKKQKWISAAVQEATGCASQLLG